MPRAYLGLGSNLDDPIHQVCRAVDEIAALPNTQLIQQSSWYRSTAVGPEQPDYINGVVAIETNLEPEPLLDALQGIEAAHQRVRAERWGPRTLDLDILLYADQVLDTNRLQVPHPWLKQRNFVILPLAELSLDLRLPDGTTVKSLRDGISRDGIWRLGD